jgi:hypothetical protein
MIKKSFKYNFAQNRTTINVEKKITKNNLDKIKTSKHFNYVASNKKNFIFTFDGTLNKCIELFDKLFLNEKNDTIKKKEKGNDNEKNNCINNDFIINDK